MASLEDLIPTVNKLQDVMYESGIDALDLPMLAVVGSQSSGKSSILETLVGRDFLPRGSGIVTRRPLVLQLINISNSSPLISPNAEAVADYQEAVEKAKSTKDNAEKTLEEHVKSMNGGHSYVKEPLHRDEWGEFLHIPNKRFYDFQDIRKEIENETARIAGQNKGISKVPINLKIFSPHVLNLTLVDLPGITKVPIADQPPDIEKQIKNLILDYVATPNCLILAVSPANVDLVNSESLKLAREVDPLGRRTIGVITKLDLMDSGTNALDILSGKLYPLKLGFVGVVNRSQHDIQLNKTVEEALNNEEEYFNKHPVYRTISHRCGTRYLAKILNKTLMAHIKAKLPDIKTKLNTLVAQTEQELASYGDINTNTKENRAGFVLQLMNKFATNFISSIDGTSSDISTKELCGGARIYYIYHNIFGQALQSINPITNLDTADIRTAIRNSTGPRATLFVPELAFDLLVKPQILLLSEPSQRCVELVYEELMKICHKCGTSELSRYPKLKSELVEVVSDLLKERLTPTRSYVESLIDIQRAYINTNHPNFLSATDAMAQISDSQKSKKMNDSLMHAETDIADQVRNIDENDKSPGSESADIESPDMHDLNSSKDTFLKYFFGKEREGVGHLNSGTGNNRLGSTADEESALRAFQTLQVEDIGNGSNVQATDEILNEKEELECELIRRLIISYFNIVREMIQDQVPKAIMCLMVNHCKDTVQNRLVTELYKESLFDDLLMEDQTLAQDRENCLKSLEVYKKASTLVNNVM